MSVCMKGQKKRDEETRGRMGKRGKRDRKERT